MTNLNELLDNQELFKPRFITLLTTMQNDVDALTFWKVIYKKAGTNDFQYKIYADRASTDTGLNELRQDGYLNLMVFDDTNLIVDFAAATI